ncbi:hypothetical protein ACFQS7_15095 [Dankookia sp. GCM10030260]|uniref:hypothetical protein n=1 Tax=Dankookia sp. GCM10030260 TaxID=3273390 RepID=UPI003623C54A
MRRRGWLILLLIAAVPALAQAQSASPQPGKGGRKPPPLDLPKLPAVPPSLKSGQAANSSVAPVPDRSKEGPRVVEQDRARINPSIINRNLPGRGHAEQGAPDVLEDKLFKPAPGARLKVPFSY